MRRNFYDMSQSAQLKHLIDELRWMSVNGKIVYQFEKVNKYENACFTKIVKGKDGLRVM